MFELLYSGVDSLYVAFQGALAPQVIEELRQARTLAEERQEKVLTKVGPGEVEAHIGPTGAKGGYAFVLDTGPEGERHLFKANANEGNWNGFVEISAGALLTRSVDDAVAHMLAILEQMGFTAHDHAVNRIDFAMDFRTDWFEPKVEQIVVHANTKVAPHIEPTTADDPTAIRPVRRGGRVESVTIGKMPGRQVIVYDKRREAVDKRKFWWFDCWGMDRDDKSAQVWRVEIRAGKRELKDKWGLAHLSDLRDSLGDILLQALVDVRYMADHQTDSNVSRHKPHPLWDAARAAIDNSDLCLRTGLLRGQVKEVERQIYIDTLAQQIGGLGISYGAAQDWTLEDLKEILPGTIKELVANILADPDRPLAKRFARAKERRRFIASHP